MFRHTVKVIATGVLGLALSTTSIVPPPQLVWAAEAPPTLEQRVTKLETEVRAIQENNTNANRKLDEIIAWINKVDRGSAELPHPRPTHVVHRPIYPDTYGGAITGDVHRGGGTNNPRTDSDSSR